MSDKIGIQIELDYIDLIHVFKGDYTKVNENIKKTLIKIKPEIFVEYLLNQVPHDYKFADRIPNRKFTELMTLFKAGHKEIFIDIPYRHVYGSAVFYTVFNGPKEDRHTFVLGSSDIWNPEISLRHLKKDGTWEIVAK